METDQSWCEKERHLQSIADRGLSLSVRGGAGVSENEGHENKLLF